MQRTMPPRGPHQLHSQWHTWLRSMGGPLAPLAGQVLRDRAPAPSGSVRRIGNARPSSADKKAVQWMDSILTHRGRSDARTWRPVSHVMVVCQNATGSCSPY